MGRLPRKVKYKDGTFAKVGDTVCNPTIPSVRYTVTEVLDVYLDAYGYAHPNVLKLRMHGMVESVEQHHFANYFMLVHS